MDLGIEYDVNELPEASGFEPIPAADYRARVDGVEQKKTKDGFGKYLELKWAIVGPSHEGRLVFDRITLKSTSEKAETYGQRQLGELMRALGIARLSDDDQLMGGECVIRVKVSPASDEYPAKNEVKGYRAVEGGSPKLAGKPAASGAKPPWAK